MKKIIIILIIILMANYGFRISQDGKDVKTCTDKECVVTSKYANLKGSMSGAGNSGTLIHNITKTITIAHGLGYIPFAKVEVEPYGDGKFSNLPYYEYFMSGQIEIYAYCDSTNLYIKFWQGNDFGESWSGVDYKYFIFIDKGKL